MIASKRTICGGILIFCLLIPVCRAQTATGSQARFTGVVKIIDSGGLTPAGLGHREFVVKQDGSYILTDNVSGKHTGRVRKKEVLKLQALIKTADFKTIKSRQFSGNCPSNYDGQERTYVFNTEKGMQTIPSCTYAIDGSLPLFKTIDALINRISTKTAAY